MIAEIPPAVKLPKHDQHYNSELLNPDRVPARYARQRGQELANGAGVQTIVRLAQQPGAIPPCQCAGVCPHRLAGQIRQDWHDWVLSVSPLEIAERLLRPLSGQRDRRIDLTVETYLPHRFGAKPTTTLLVYTLDGQITPVRRPLVLPMHAFQRLLDHAGIYIAQTAPVTGVIHDIVRTQTYTLRYRGFYDLTTGAFVDKAPERTEPIDNVFTSPAYLHKANAPRFGGR